MILPRCLNVAHNSTCENTFSTLVTAKTCRSLWLAFTWNCNRTFIVEIKRLNCVNFTFHCEILFFLGPGGQKISAVFIWDSKLCFFYLLDLLCAVNELASTVGHGQGDTMLSLFEKITVKTIVRNIIGRFPPAVCCKCGGHVCYKMT